MSIPTQHRRPALCAIILIGAILSASPAARAQDQSSVADNEQVVLDFFAAMDKSSAAGTLRQDARQIGERFIDPDYVQHNETYAKAGTGREGFIRLTQTMLSRPRPAGMPMPKATRVALIGQGDKVVIVTSRALPDPTTGTLKVATIFNMFRLKNGKLAEHWDAGLPQQAAGGQPPGQMTSRMTGSPHPGN